MLRAVECLSWDIPAGQMNGVMAEMAFVCSAIALYMVSCSSRAEPQAVAQLVELLTNFFARHREVVHSLARENRDSIILKELPFMLMADAIKHIVESLRHILLPLDAEIAAPLQRLIADLLDILHSPVTATASV